MKTGEKLFFEDFEEGQVFRSGETEVSEEDIVAFARSFDPQSFHLDPEAAKDSFFGTHVASGWHTVAVAMRLMVEALPVSGGVIGGGAENVRWPRPVYPGDLLHVEIEVEGKRAMRSRKDIGLVNIKVTGIDQKGETVLVMQPRLIAPYRERA